MNQRLVKIIIVSLFNVKIILFINSLNNTTLKYFLAFSLEEYSLVLIISYHIPIVWNLALGCIVDIVGNEG